MRLIISVVFTIFFFFHKPKVDPIVTELEHLYAQLGFSALFTKIRCWDAPLAQIEKLTPKSGKIIELGSGEGLSANYLALSSGQRQVLGVEIDKERISQAQRGIKNTQFVHGDITKYEIPKANGILLVHVLHHLDTFESQIKVLEKSFKALTPGGKLILVEVEPMWSWKYLSALFVDHFLVPWLFEHRFYSPILFRPKEQWIKILDDLGFRTRAISANKGMPFAHIIFECTKV